MGEESHPPAPAGQCPICNADDAYVARFDDRDVVFVECVNCRVYLATRKAFRHLEYLRWRQDPAGLRKLERLAACLNTRARDTAVRLDYDTWESVADQLGQ